MEYADLTNDDSL
jgi:hypothetical protein